MAKIFRNRNIRKNKEVLKELGLPVSKRKFDRHVPNTDKAVESNCTSPQKEEIQSEQLVNGEEVYLLIEGKEIFKATFDSNETDTVHGVPVQEGEGRFFITKVLRGAIKWDSFDSDTMSEGAPILWRIECLKRHAFNKVKN